MSSFPTESFPFDHVQCSNAKNKNSLPSSPLSHVPPGWPWRWLHRRIVALMHRARSQWLRKVLALLTHSTWRTGNSVRSRRPNRDRKRSGQPGHDVRTLCSSAGARGSMAGIGGVGAGGERRSEGVGRRGIWHPRAERMMVEWRVRDSLTNLFD